MNLLLLLMLLGQESPFPDGDPAPAIETAKKKAAAENRRVLTLWGSNDDEASRAAATLLKKDKQVARLILYEYDLVLADVRHADASMKRVMVSEKFPWISMPDADGRGVGYYMTPVDSKSMIEFLNKFKAKPLVAQDVLDAAKKKAAAEKKRVLLTFGAPW